MIITKHHWLSHSATISNPMDCNILCLDCLGVLHIRRQGLFGWLNRLVRDQLALVGSGGWMSWMAGGWSTTKSHHIAKRSQAVVKLHGWRHNLSDLRKNQLGCHRLHKCGMDLSQFVSIGSMLAAASAESPRIIPSHHIHFITLIIAFSYWWRLIPHFLHAWLGRQRICGRLIGRPGPRFWRWPGDLGCLNHGGWWPRLMVDSIIVG